MFRIECLCDDKNLPKVLHAISGLVLRQGFDCQPVAADTRIDGRGRVANNGGTRLEVFAGWLSKSNAQQLDTNAVRVFMKSHGYAPTASSQLLHEATRAGILRRVGVGVYVRAASGQKALAAPKKGA